MVREGNGSHLWKTFNYPISLFVPIVVVMGTVVKIDERGRLVIPSKFRNKVETNYFELSEEEGKLVLTPIPDPLKTLIGRVSRVKPIKDLDETAEKEAERTTREEKKHANSGS